MSEEKFDPPRTGAAAIAQRLRARLRRDPEAAKRLRSALLDICECGGSVEHNEHADGCEHRKWSGNELLANVRANAEVFADWDPRAALADLRSDAEAEATASERSTVRDLHLVWNGTEWVDDRCGCRYHPDDDRGSHGGGPHVHACDVHRTEYDALIRASERARLVMTSAEDRCTSLDTCSRYEPECRTRGECQHARLVSMARQRISGKDDAVTELLKRFGLSAGGGAPTVDVFTSLMRGMLTREREAGGLRELEELVRDVRRENPEATTVWIDVLITRVAELRKRIDP